MREGLRSLNVAMAAAMAVGEALRQLASSRSKGDEGPTAGS
jgi:tRNA(Leu) C34 or U34 (ribose-2'-O)-methylase TrmL